ncbi:hypothetical protein [Achromobacter animicus]|uniref:hypothetical protein n=1 Tax=Achromobacter animicus TaxID=1389935 RepID=UPI0028A97BC5|nr:hypothetical protein [Achromobacter animicus]
MFARIGAKKVLNTRKNFCALRAPFTRLRVMNRRARSAMHYGKALRCAGRAAMKTIARCGY